MTIRADEVYGLGGFDPDHPSGNVLDAFITDEDATVTVKHYDAAGEVLVDRPLDEAEVEFFYGGDTDYEEMAAVRAIGDASVHERVSQQPA